MYEIKTYWQQENNIGDKLTPYILRNLFKVEPVFKNRGNKLLGIGSILSHANRDDVIWGSGLISPKHLPKSNKLNVLALRGPDTKRELKKFEVDIKDCPYGDPALLLPRVYNPEPIEVYERGIIPHYTDFDFVKHEYSKQEDRGEVLIIDVRWEIEDFIDALTSCKLILSSSLHGLILADAYNIANNRVKYNNKLVGGDFKFDDYQKSKKYINLRDLESVLKCYLSKKCD